MSERERLAADLFIALIGNPERYKYIAGMVGRNQLTQEEATEKNIHKAYELADQFFDYGDRECAI